MKCDQLYKHNQPQHNWVYWTEKKRVNKTSPCLWALRFGKSASLMRESRPIGSPSLLLLPRTSTRADQWEGSSVGGGRVLPESRLVGGVRSKRWEKGGVSVCWWISWYQSHQLLISSVASLKDQTQVFTRFHHILFKSNCWHPDSLNVKIKLQLIFWAHQWAVYSRVSSIVTFKVLLSILQPAFLHFWKF